MTTRHKSRAARERYILSLLQLRRGSVDTSVKPEDRRVAPRSINPSIPLEDYESALGALKSMAAETGETPDAICRRLGITGVRRRTLIPQGGSGRWRLNADERRASYRTRDPLRTIPQRQHDERRASILGVTLDSPEWLAIMARDRAFAAKMKKMRDEAGPPHPMRAKHYAKK